LNALKDRLSDTDKFDYYPVKPLPKNLMLRYRSEDYFSQEPEKLGSIDYGIVMHEILSRVKKKDDLEKSVEIAYMEGKIDPLSKVEIIDSFYTGFNKSIPVEIFQPGWKTFTERDILTTDGEYRPDRVLFKENSAIVIDYKFGMEIRRSHTSQVIEYLKRVKETGYSNVKGYVWYFTLGKVEEVRDE
jgi:ATP-dependent helicase/nuclease subunit A